MPEETAVISWIGLNLNKYSVKDMHSKIVRFLLLFALIFNACDRICLQPDQQDEKWSFVVFSDVQDGYGVFGKLSENIGNLKPVPNAAFCCGDIMYYSGNEAKWASFENAAKSIRQNMPLFFARGNHDGNDSASEDILRLHANLTSDHFYYTHSEGNTLFIVLDIYERGKEGSIIGEQLKWLQSQLDSAGSNPSVSNIFILMHRPLYPQGRHKGENLSNADDLHQLFLKYNKIRAIIAGHDHLFNKYVKDNIMYITTGGGGGPLYHGYGGDYHHFLKVSFYEDTTQINVKTIDIFNETIDDFDL
jgi:predicted phosphodiesterase